MEKKEEIMAAQKDQCPIKRKCAFQKIFGSVKERTQKI